jgi:hypothetical protein
VAEPDDIPQTIADELAPFLPKRWSIFSAEVTLRAGMAASPVSQAVTVRALVGGSVYRSREISGIGPDLATALVQLHNRAREIEA